MKIIIDSCSVILLTKATVLEKLSGSYNILIPIEVYNEVLKGKEKMLKDALLVEKLKNENKISLINIDKKLKKKIMQDFNMGEGESSVIAGGIRNNNLVATDNRQGRKAAEINSLQLIGSIEIVVNLFRKRKIDYEKAYQSLKLLKEEGWFDNNLIEKAMEDIENDRS